MGIYPGVLWPVSATGRGAEMPIGDNQRFVPASGKDGISPYLNIRDLIHSLDGYQDNRHGRGHPAGGHPPERPPHYPGICRRQLRRSDKRTRVVAVTLNDQSRPTTQARQAGDCLPQQVRPYQRKPRQFFTEGRGKCRSIKLLLFNRSTIIRTIRLFSK